MFIVALGVQKVLPLAQLWQRDRATHASNVISENLSKSAFFKKVGQFERKFQTEEGIAHHSLMVSKTKVIALS